MDSQFKYCPKSENLHFMNLSLRNINRYRPAKTDSSETRYRETESSESRFRQPSDYSDSRYRQSDSSDRFKSAERTTSKPEKGPNVIFPRKNLFPKLNKLSLKNNEV